MKWNNIHWSEKCAIPTPLWPKGAWLLKPYFILSEGKTIQISHVMFCKHPFDSAHCYASFFINLPIIPMRTADSTYWLMLYTDAAWLVEFQHFLAYFRFQATNVFLILLSTMPYLLLATDLFLINTFCTVRFITTPLSTLDFIYGTVVLQCQELFSALYLPLCSTYCRWVWIDCLSVLYSDLHNVWDKDPPFLHLPLYSTIRDL